MQFDQNIIKIVKSEFPEKPNGMKLKKWLKEHPDVEHYVYSLLEQYESFVCIGNVWHCIFNNIDVDTLICKHCKKPTKMTTTNIIREYCSCKCAANSEEKKRHNKETIAKDKDYYSKRQKKIEETNLKLYGVKAPAMCDEIKQKMKDTYSKDPDIWKKRNEKLKQTIVDKYGVTNISQLDQIKELKKQTVFNNYGVEHQMLSFDVKNKVKQTCLQRYGVDNIFKSDKVRQKILDKSWNNICTWKDYVTPNFTRKQFIGYNNQELEWKCSKCGQIFKQQVYSTKYAKHVSVLVPRCHNCYPCRNTSSVSEQEIADFCKQYKQIEQHNKTLIYPYELDIIIPDKKIAIEYDGMYWHSDAIDRITDHYHLDKTELCEQQGYKLIHIFENDWLNKRSIIESKIKSILGIDQVSIYARKCCIKELDTVSVFLNQNHLQGEDKSSIKLGLYYDDLLVAVMTFGKPRFNEKYQYELIRYATLSGYRVIGGAGKLLKYFERMYNPDSIITYADRRYSQGNMYIKLGFMFSHNSEPSYYWIKDNYCLTRYQCQKHKLKNILGDKFNPQLSENENMYLNGWNKIYDCGNMIFVK